MALALIVSEKNDLNTKPRQKSVNCKSRSSLKIEHRVDLNSSRRMHDPNFIALALIVSEIWLVGCFGLNGPLRQYFSLYRAVSQREGERKEK